MRHEARYDVELGIMIVVLVLTAFVAGCVVGHLRPEAEPCNYGIARIE